MKTKRKSYFHFVVFVLLILVAGQVSSFAQPPDTVDLWFGNLDGSPINVDINEHVFIDLYILTGEGVYVANCIIILGVMDQYIDSLLSLYEGIMYYPFNLWEIAEFGPSRGSPPNFEGWSSQPFIGWARIAGDAPWLHYDTPTLGLRYRIKTADDSLNIGDDAPAIGPGFYFDFPITCFGDTLDRPGFAVTQEFSILHFIGGGYIEGHITDEWSEPIESVSVVNTVTGKEVFCDENGFYHMGHFPGTFDLMFSHPDYVDTTITDIEFVIDQTIDMDITLRELPTGIDDYSTSVECKFLYSRNYPNPFSATTSISFTMPDLQYVELKVYDILGKEVDVLVKEYRPAGEYTVEFNAPNLANGIYFYSIKTGKYSHTGRMVLLK